jgi:hypothetical protein
LRNIYDSTYGIIFLGTPHSGTILATLSGRLAQLISPATRTNLRIVNVLRRDSEVLARIRNEFHSLLRCRRDDGDHEIEITCFYEELPLPAIGVVVPKHSAILPGYTAIGIHKDHREMVRFTGADDPGFISVLGELQRWTKEIKASHIELERGGVSGATETITNTTANNVNLGGITIWGDVVKSNVVSRSQTIHGGLTFRD